MAMRSKQARRGHVALPTELAIDTEDPIPFTFEEIARAARLTKHERYLLEQVILWGRTRRELADERGCTSSRIGQILRSAEAKARQAVDRLFRLE